MTAAAAQDHWSTEWLRAYLRRDTAALRAAALKGGEASGTSSGGGQLLPQSFANVIRVSRQAPPREMGRYASQLFGDLFK